MTKTKAKSSSGHGGIRAGAGRPFRPLTLFKHTYLGERIIVKRFSHGQYRRHKTTRIEIILDTLFIRAMNGDLKAIKSYLDLVLGKPQRESLPDENESMEMRSPFLQFNEVIAMAYPETPTKKEGDLSSVLEEKMKRWAEGSEQRSDKNKPVRQEIPARIMPPESNISEGVFRGLRKPSED